MLAFLALHFSETDVGSDAGAVDEEEWCLELLRKLLLTKTLFFLITVLRYSTRLLACCTILKLILLCPARKQENKRHPALVEVRLGWIRVSWPVTMAKTWSLRYMFTRLKLGMDETFAQMQTTTATLPIAVQKGVEAYRKELTKVIYLSGASMVPALNAKASTDPSAVEKLLIRLFPRPSFKDLYAGDTVALQSPLSAEQQVLVRRLAAVEGEEMVSDDTELASWSLPQGHCWVLTEADTFKPNEVIDSRSFGPLPVENIIGRVVYQCQSPTEHGPTSNSTEAMADDAVVLDAELDVDSFCSKDSQTS